MDLSAGRIAQQVKSTVEALSVLIQPINALISSNQLLLMLSLVLWLLQEQSSQEALLALCKLSKVLVELLLIWQMESVTSLFSLSLLDYVKLHHLKHN